MSERVHGFILPNVTPQCFSGSYSRYLTGNTLLLRLLLLLLPEFDAFDELVGELLFDDELVNDAFVDIDATFRLVDCVLVADVLATVALK